MRSFLPSAVTPSPMNFVIERLARSPSRSRSLARASTRIEVSPCLAVPVSSTAIGGLLKSFWPRTVKVERDASKSPLVMP